MSDQNKATLEQANAAIRAGDHEGFLSHCQEDLVWTTVGQDSLRGNRRCASGCSGTTSTRPNLPLQN